MQSEINMLMKVADSMGFTVNTFTHILEGYKLADKMKEHGVGASTFSDWWAYKFVPTAFTPNNDNQNDRWEIVGLDSKYPTNSVRIFNRWGELLFESVEGKYSNNEWDGTYNGEALPVGSYYYIIELAKYNSNEPINGTVSIIRLK